jgi:hypothetical protein
MKMVKKEYRIVVLQAYPNESVMLTLVPIYSITVEESPPPPTAERVLVGPLHESDEAKVAKDMVKAIGDELRRQGMWPSSQTAPAAFTPMVAVLLTKEEYEELGRPTPYEIVSLSLTLDRQAEPQKQKESEKTE